MHGLFGDLLGHLLRVFRYVQRRLFRLRKRLRVHLLGHLLRRVFRLWQRLCLDMQRRLQDRVFQLYRELHGFLFRLLQHLYRELLRVLRHLHRKLFRNMFHNVYRRMSGNLRHRLCLNGRRLIHERAALRHTGLDRP